VYAAWLVLLAGCGRLGFGEPRPDARTDSVAIDATDPCAGDLLCDGFEGTMLGNGWVMSGAVAIDNTFAHSGASSVHMHLAAIAAGDTMAARIIHPTLLQTPGPLWIRAWIRLGGLPAGGDHLELECMEQSGSPSFGDCVFAYATQTALYSQFAGASMETTAAPLNTWFCVVWSVVRSPTAGAMHLTSDAFPDADLPGVATTSASRPVDVLAIGASYSGTNTPDAAPPTDVWFDDVAIRTSPLACP